MSWHVTHRDRNGRIDEYTSDDGRWQLRSQPFTPVWHVYEKVGGEFKFVRDEARVSDAKAYAEKWSNR